MVDVSTATLRSMMSSLLVAAQLPEPGVDSRGGMTLDFSKLDYESTRGSRQEALRKVAGLALRLDRGVRVVVTTPSRHAGQVALAASGLLFAFAQHSDAEFIEARESTQGELIDAAPYRRLLDATAWRRGFSANDKALRDALISGVTEARVRAAGVLDDDFIALVNPHLEPGMTAARDVAGLVRPMVGQFAEDADDRGTFVSNVLSVLGEALENVGLHAFRGVSDRLSLITLGRVRPGGADTLRVQVLDNGIGIPESIARYRGEDLPDLARGKELLELAINASGEPLLPGGRGRGLPRMRELAGRVGGELTVMTAGPDDTLLTVECKSAKPAEAFADKLPLPGTIVTLQVPLPGGSN